MLFKMRVCRLALSLLAFMPLLSNALAAPAAALSTDVDYGEMYVLQKHETPVKPWEVAFNYTYAFSNPYMSIHGLNLGLNRQLGEFFLAGISGSFFQTRKNSVTEDLEANLGAQGISATLYRPRYSTYANFTVIPLAGMLNWFNATPVNFDLALGVGAGIAGYQNELRYLPSMRAFIMPKLMIGKSWGFTAGLNTTYDRFNSSDWQNRIETSFGLLARF